MKDSVLIAKRYAEALFNLCVRANCLEPVEKAFDAFVRDISRNPKFVIFMESPVIPQAKKEELLEKMIPENLPPLLKLFLKLILAKKRFQNLKVIEAAFQTLSEKQRGVRKAELISAVAVEPSTQKKLVAILEKKLSSQINLISKTDPKLIGGFILKLDERVVDASYQTKLRELRQQLAAAPV